MGGVCDDVVLAPKAGVLRGGFPAGPITGYGGRGRIADLSAVNKSLFRGPAPAGRASPGEI